MLFDEIKKDVAFVQEHERPLQGRMIGRCGPARDPRVKARTRCFLHIAAALRSGSTSTAFCEVDAVRCGIALFGLAWGRLFATKLRSAAATPGTCKAGILLLLSRHVQALAEIGSQHAAELICYLTLKQLIPWVH